MKKVLMALCAFLFAGLASASTIYTDSNGVAFDLDQATEFHIPSAGLVNVSFASFTNGSTNTSVNFGNAGNVLFTKLTAAPGFYPFQVYNNDGTLRYQSYRTTKDIASITCINGKATVVRTDGTTPPSPWNDSGCMSTSAILATSN